MFDKYSMYITYATPLCIKKISIFKDQDGRLILHMFRFIYVGRAWGLDDGPLSWVLTVDMVRTWWGNCYSVGNCCAQVKSTHHRWWVKHGSQWLVDDVQKWIICVWIISILSHHFHLYPSPNFSTDSILRFPNFNRRMVCRGCSEDL